LRLHTPNINSNHYIFIGIVVVMGSHNKAIGETNWYGVNLSPMVWLLYYYFIIIILFIIMNTKGID
jgi:hypothetical protein